jgi:hydroxypyruvate isomerase
MRAIAESGFSGYVGQEFVPQNPDALESLRQAVAICDV